MPTSTQYSGQPKVGVQYLNQCADRLDMNGGTTRITFGTEQMLTPSGTDKLGIIVWLDRDAVKDAIAQHRAMENEKEGDDANPS
jgi:hypothetical protein